MRIYRAGKSSKAHKLDGAWRVAAETTKLSFRSISTCRIRKEEQLRRTHLLVTIIYSLWKMGLCLRLQNFANGPGRLHSRLLAPVEHRNGDVLEHQRRWWEFFRRFNNRSSDNSQYQRCLAKSRIRLVLTRATTVLVALTLCRRTTDSQAVSESHRCLESDPRKHQRWTISVKQTAKEATVG